MADEAEVIELECYRNVWIGGLGLCGSCGALWRGVCHEDRQWGLECPKCHEMTGLILPAGAVNDEDLYDYPDLMDRWYKDPTDFFTDPDGKLTG